MALAAIRTQLIRSSGDNSLSVDNIGDFYINAGQRMLDDMVHDTTHATTRLVQTIAAGAWYATFLRYRIIQSIWIAKASGRLELEKKDLNWLRDNYPFPESGITTGTPAFYTVDAADLNAESHEVAAAYSANYDVDDIIFATGTQGSPAVRPYTQTRILFFPPSDGTYTTLNVFGQFYNAEFSAAADTTYWSERYPDLLVQAALYQLEILDYNNDTGADARLKTLQFGIDGITKNIAKQNFQGVNNMRRSSYVKT